MELRQYTTENVTDFSGKPFCKPGKNGLPSTDCDWELPLIGGFNNEISRSAFDYFSFGHIIMGHVSYLIMLYIMTSLGYTDLHALIGVLVVSFGWELLENTLLLKLGVKRHIDTAVNSAVDNVLVFIGSLIAYFVMDPTLNLYVLLAEIFLFMTSGFITVSQNKTTKF